MQDHIQKDKKKKKTTNIVLHIINSIIFIKLKCVLHIISS